MKPPSQYQRRILAWLQDNHPHGWVTVHGIGMVSCRGLATRKLLELRGKTGAYEVRLTDAGRIWKSPVNKKEQAPSNG